MDATSPMRYLKVLGAAAACAALLVLAPSVGALANNGESPAELRVQSFSGAFLAARTAEFDNDLENAVRFYRRALAYDPENEEIQRGLMLALISSERFEEALPIAEKLKAVPEVERFSRLALAIDSFRDKEYADAEFWLQLALESDLDRLITSVMGAWAKFGQGDAEGAINGLSRLEGPPWFSLFADYHRALIAEQAGRNDQAREAFHAAVTFPSGARSAPETYWRAVAAEARFLARLGQREEALKILAGEGPASTRNPEIRELEAAIRGGLTIMPLVSSPADGVAEILLNVGSALNRGGGEAFVRLYLQFALVLRPESDAALLQLGHVAEQQNLPEEAIAFYRRVAPASPLKRMAEMQLGLNLADIGRNDEAIDHLRALVDSDPDDMRAYLALGGVYSAGKDYARSAELYDRAVARIGTPVREHWSIFYHRGISYERLKQWEKAEPNFRKALELEPDQPQVLNYLGYSWVDMNMNLEEGLEMIARAVELRPNDGYIVDSLGWAYYRLGRFEEAVDALEKAVSLRPDDPVLNDHLGDAYWRVGRKLQAVFQWSHARDLEPEPEVLAAVERKLVEGLPPLAAELGEKVAMAPRVAMDGGTLNDASGTEAGEDRIHTVRSGQSLWSIAVEELGDGFRLNEILRLNPGLSSHPDRIYPGQQLRLPAGGR
jgi:tetratricopeptide (TPR) repeat protein